MHNGHRFKLLSMPVRLLPVRLLILVLCASASCEPRARCHVGDNVECPGSDGVRCTGDQCCPDGSACPSALKKTVHGCPKPKETDCVVYKPVIMMHGVGDNHGEMATIARLLNETHPGTVATALPLYENSPASWDHSLQKQVDGVAAAIRKLVAGNPALYKDGYHMVCKSQGALTCRCVIESMDDHNVDTFVSLAGPQVAFVGQARTCFCIYVFFPAPQDGVYGTAFFKQARTRHCTTQHGTARHGTARHGTART